MAEELIQQQPKVEQPKKIKAVEAKKDFIEQLKEGYWLGVSERYLENNKWSLEKIARDAWQNFYDANNFTLDGIDIDITHEDEKEQISIKGDESYDYRRLIGFGLSEKADKERSAGGKGEGTRMMALQMLRDWDFEKVVFGADDWELEFYLDKAPAGSVPEDEQDLDFLYVKYHEKEFEKGNYARFVTTREGLAEDFVKARDLFRHSKNEDFEHIDIETENGGFTYLGKDEKGNFYLNGQRISYGETDKWQTVPSFNIWSNRTPKFEDKEMTIGRDRESIDSMQMKYIFLPFLVESMNKQQLEKTLRILEPFYEAEKYPIHEGIKFLEAIIDRLEKEGMRFEFDPKYIADDISTFGEGGPAQILKGRGYVVCNENLSRIGMRKASEEIRDLGHKNEKPVSPEEQQRVDILVDSLQQLFDVEEEALAEMTQFKSVVFEPKPIKIFHNSHPLLGGQYEEGIVWLKSKKLYAQDIDDVLATYIHEICHVFGSDESAEFTYALTKFLSIWNKFLRKNPKFLETQNKKWQKVAMKEQSEQWNLDEIIEFYQSLPELESYKQPLFSEKIQIENMASHLEDASLVNFPDLPLAQALMQIYDQVNNSELMVKLENLTDQFGELLSQQRLISDESHINISRKKENFKKELKKLEQKVEAEMDKIEAGKGGTRSKKRKIQESQIPIWEEQIHEIKKEIAELNRAYLQTEYYKIETQIQIVQSELKKVEEQLKDYEIFPEIKKTDLRDLNRLGIFLSASLQAIYTQAKYDELSERQIRKYLAQIINFVKEKHKQSKKISLTFDLKILFQQELERIKSDLESKPSAAKITYASVLIQAYESAYK